MTSNNRSNGFRVTYRGRGCIDGVVIVIRLEDGTSATLEYDMCPDLGPAWVVPYPSPSVNPSSR
jgi:hypothetical protein